MGRGLAIFLYAASALAGAILSMALPGQLPLSGGVAWRLGLLAVLPGLALAAWAVATMRWGILGGIYPVAPGLVREGPYRLVRHPLYLGLILALAGMAISLRSGSGLLGVLGLFVPSAVYRARLEERDLAAVFGRDWEDHAARTGFILPQRK
ncbi:MAG: isoprenylcysteine carboxylmethyltransferase family protein [bacterium]|nr:isoprenylcysteine carboxylmethyltransferase family protein [bacterium]